VRRLAILERAGGRRGQGLVWGFVPGLGGQVRSSRLRGKPDRPARRLACVFFRTANGWLVGCRRGNTLFIMPSVYDLKPGFQALLRPLTRWLAAAGVTANHVTVSATILSVGVGIVVGLVSEARWPLLLLPAALLLRMALNAIDGMLAREHGMKSALGAVLNELGDVVSDTALYLPCALRPEFDAHLVVVVVVLAVITEMTGVVAVQIGSERRYDGPMGKSDRAFLFGLLGLLLGAGLAPGSWVDWLLGVVVVLLVLTVINRARAALRPSALRPGVSTVGER